ncbi:IS21 family transposase [Desulfitibacter alkalitolerans]|jgi:transposase|uniref:IS21 family transposase n=1 Tax=Desulfitibacter alkalitolerans TaxID=264641 RepID=UPI00068819DB|nr:IS21 family transposase [Desulfitibacter alkalitolerans]
MKFNIVTDIEINSVKDLSKLRIFVEANNLDKPNFSEIARNLGVDRRTVKKYYEGADKKERKKKKSIIDDYYEIIKYLLSEGSSQVFYYKDHLFRYLQREHGLKCTRNNFNYYILKNEEFAKYFKPKGNPNSVKSETPLGQQAQFDWKEKIKFQFNNGEEVVLNVGSLVLSASRLKVWVIYLSVSLDCILDFLANAFETIGGVPQELVIDNATTMMIKARTETSDGTVNPKFQQFADDYGFKVFPCIAGRPNTKAKVESPMKVIDEIMAYNGVLNTLEELHEKLEKITNEANIRICQNTGIAPILVYKKEKEHLSPLPQEKICSSYKLSSIKVNVNTNALIPYKKKMYSVPSALIGKKVTIQVIENNLHVYYNKKLITVHEIVENKKIIYNEHHHLEILKQTFRKHDGIEDYALKHLKELEKFNEQLSDIV